MAADERNFTTFHYSSITCDIFSVAEKLEDSIMTSGLPLHALWIRTEHLRSCVHFLPALEETGDHQRLVLPEDIAPLLYPITPDLSTRLSSVAVTLLKVRLFRSHPTII
ncbi:unnamed protein product, partial [Nesidiocoris tenuis]